MNGLGGASCMLVFTWLVLLTFKAHATWPLLAMTTKEASFRVTVTYYRGTSQDAQSSDSQKYMAFLHSAVHLTTLFWIQCLEIL